MTNPKLVTWDTHDMDENGVRHPFKKLVAGWAEGLKKHADEERATRGE